MFIEETPRKGASRTPAELFPIITLECFSNVEKYANLIEGICLKLDLGNFPIVLKIISHPGSLFGEITMKFFFVFFKELQQNWISFFKLSNSEVTE